MKGWMGVGEGENSWWKNGSGDGDGSDYDDDLTVLYKSQREEGLGVGKKEG